MQAWKHVDCDPSIYKARPLNNDDPYRYSIEDTEHVRYAPAEIPEHGRPSERPNASGRARVYYSPTNTCERS